ncbi:MAG: SAM domain-containing protein, partial [Rhizobiaceae bacterium]
MQNNIASWLTEIGLGEYADAFIENAVDDDLLPHLTNDDLRELGVAKLGDRKKILLAIEGIGAGTEVSPRASTT